MAIVDYLDAISTEADLDQPSVGVVRVLDKFGQGDVWPPDEPFAEFAQQLRVHGEVLVTLLNRQRTPRLIRLK